MGKVIKALTVIQPWAWAIIHGGKLVENRSWPTDYRGPLLIHAGKSTVHLIDPANPPEISPRLEFGAAIGTVDLIDCVRREDLPEDHPYAEGPWCWILANPKPITPTPMPGQRRLFNAHLPTP